MSAAETNEPSAAKKAMLSGVGVSRIQNLPCVGSSADEDHAVGAAEVGDAHQARAPAPPASSASHRHTSQTVPSAAVTTRGHGGEALGHDAGVVADRSVARRRRRRRRSVAAPSSLRRRASPSAVRTVGRASRAPSSSPPHAASDEHASGTEHERHDIAATVGVSVTRRARRRSTCESCGAPDERPATPCTAAT